MSAQQCAAITTPQTLWTFCPNVGAAYAFAVFFGLTLIAHIAQGIYHRKIYSWAIAMSALWQLLTYIFRILSIQNAANDGQYTAWFVLMLLAPLWTNAYVYVSTTSPFVCRKLSWARWCWDEWFGTLLALRKCLASRRGISPKFSLCWTSRRCSTFLGGRQTLTV